MALTKVPGTLIANDAITSTKIVDGTIVSADIANTTITSGNMALDPRNASNLSTGSVPAAQLGNAPSYDDSKVLNDIATLALHSATQNNQSAYNLTNAFIDQFEDSTGLDVLTDVQRNTSGEYMSSIAGVGGIDAYTVLMLHCDGSNNAQVWTDSSTTPHTMSASSGSYPRTETGTKKFGTASGKWNNSTYLSAPDSADWNFGSDDWTIDFWLYHPQNPSNDHFDFIISQPNSTSPAGQSYFGTRHTNSGNYYMMGNNSVGGAGAGSDSFAVALNTWAHYAICQNGNYQYHYKDGISVNGVGTGKSSTVAFSDMNVPLRVGYQQDVEYYNGYADEIRISKGIARYPGGLTFTPFTQAYDVLSTNATGNWTSTTETALSTVSKMSIVVLYKNEDGTATLDTDLVAQVSADGGSNYTAAPLTAGGTFSAGILIAKSNDITISNTGTAPKYKISFANQSDGSKVTRVYGVALMY